MTDLFDYFQIGEVLLLLMRWQKRTVYWWTKMHHTKGGVKAHTLYDVKTDVPAFVVVTCP